MAPQDRKSTALPQTAKARGSDPIVLWRREQLVRSGLPLSMATRAAKNAGYDLHALIELLSRRCPPELAIRHSRPHRE
jgi:hypothetical protein